MDPSSLKILQGAAGAAGAEKIGVEDVFKTYVYKGNGNTSTQVLNTKIPLSTYGGLIWTKGRDQATNGHYLFDSERSSYGKRLISSSYGSESTETDINAVSDTGITITSHSNNNNDKYVAWTFRKAEKFFDIVTYTGNGTAGRQISHNLGCVPGVMIVKARDINSSSYANWSVYHRSIDSSSPENYVIKLNTTDSRYTDNDWNDTAPSSTHFTVGSAWETNKNGENYICYLFAHEEAEFGPNSDQKIISCGSYEGTGSAGLSVTLPFEPQYVWIKNADRNSTNWVLFDSMRKIVDGGDDAVLKLNSNNSESASINYIDLTPTGFTVQTTSHDDTNQNGDTYIYIAIAAETGKTMKAIETGSDVFTMDTGNASTTIPVFDSGFPVDFAMNRAPGSATSWYTSARLMQDKYLLTNSSNAENQDDGAFFDSNTGWAKDAYNTWNSSYQSWMWKRHAGFDVVTYIGVNPSSDSQSISHSLGKVPEMMWIKKRSGTGSWNVYHKGLNGGTNPEQYSIQLNSSSAEGQYATDFNNTAPTSTHFTVGPGNSTNHHFQNYIAILFATVNGVSEVGSYDGSSSTVTITTGFQPRFVIIKRATGVGQWTVFDTTRGWGSGNDKLLELSDNAAQTNNYDAGAPTSTGFTVTSGQSAINNNGDKYIYYAHA